MSSFDPPDGPPDQRSSAELFEDWKRATCIAQALADRNRRAAATLRGRPIGASTAELHKFASAAVAILDEQVDETEWIRRSDYEAAKANAAAWRRRSDALKADKRRLQAEMFAESACAGARSEHQLQLCRDGGCIWIGDDGRCVVDLWEISE